MSGEMIAIVAVGVALAGVILTSLRGEARLGETCAAKWASCANAWRMRSENSANAWRSWKDCWKDCARPSPGGPAPANAGPRRIWTERIAEKVMNSSKKGLTKAMRSDDSIIRAESLAFGGALFPA